MERQKAFLILEVTLCASLFVSLLLVSHYVYADVLRFVFFPCSMLTSWVTVTVINWKSEANTERPRMRWFTFVVLTLAAGTFILFRPHVTYRQGASIASSWGYENIHGLPDKSVLAFEFYQSAKYAANAYLYAGEKKGVRYYVLVSPHDGAVEAIEIGTGNYLDMYFERKRKESL